MTFPEPMTFIQAMARMEGFYQPGSRSNRNNNPGDIEWGPFAKAHGAIKGDPRFAVFDIVENGWAAQKALIIEKYQGMTVAAAIAKYAPPNENNTQEYINYICQWCACNPTDIVDTLLG